MNMMEAVKTCFTKYIDISGRASRSEYWWFTLFCIILEIVTALISQNLYYIAVLAVMLPSLTVLIRRLHDTNQSGWMALLILIPIIGALIILYFMVIKGTEGPNTYGLPPL